MTPLESSLVEQDGEGRTTELRTLRPLRRHAKRTISRPEALGAIYIDFEGCQGEPPSLMGILQEDAFEQIVLSQELASAAEAKGLRAASGAAVLEGLLACALQEGRRICAFSEHELHAAREHWGIDLEPVYVNARPVVKRWWNRVQPGERPLEWSQEALERAMGILRPQNLRSGHAARRLRDVRTQLQRRRTYAKLTGTAKAKWTTLLKYNRLDVEHMAAMVRRAAGDVADGSLASRPTRLTGARQGTSI